MISVFDELAACCWLNVSKSEEFQPVSRQDPIGDSAPELVDRKFFLTGTDTFAVLDAAKFQHVPEALVGLEHASLFQGRAEEDYKDVAPYIMRLDPETAFTRSFFVRSGAPTDLWDRDAAVFVQAAQPDQTLTLGNLRAHFRHFTRQRTDQGTWVFVRIAEPKSLPYYLMGLANTPGRLLNFLTRDNLSLVFHIFDQNRLISVSPSAELLTQRKMPAHLGAPEITAFRRYRWDTFCTRVERNLADEYPDLAQTAALSHARVDAWCRSGRALGITSEMSLLRFATACLIAESFDTSLDSIRKEITDWSILSQKDQTQKLLELVSDRCF